MLGGKGIEQLVGWDIVTDRVKVRGVTTSRNQSHIYSALLLTNASLPPAKILCAVYTHAGDHHLTQRVADIWGWRCDGSFAASNQTVDDPTRPAFGAIDLPHYGPEMYDNMWQKTRSILGYMHDNYLNDYDYFYVAGMLLVENLRYYSAEVESKHGHEQIPIYTGFVVRSAIPNGYFDFAVGGTGYILNRKALKILVSR